MHELAIDILSGKLTGIALKESQLKDRTAQRNYADVALLQRQVAALKYAVACLKSDRALNAQTRALCRLLDRLTWHDVEGKARCRICNFEKPAHEPDCPIHKHMTAIHDGAASSPRPGAPAPPEKKTQRPDAPAPPEKKTQRPGGLAPPDAEISNPKPSTQETAQ